MFSFVHEKEPQQFQGLFDLYPRFIGKGVRTAQGCLNDIPEKPEIGVFLVD